jgi:polar amino acid transport system substrate-binding protein
MNTVRNSSSTGGLARRTTRWAAMAVAAGMALSTTVVAAGGSAGAASYYGNVKVVASLHAAVPAKFDKSGVKVAVFNDWPPDEFIQNGKLVGWSVDLAHAIGTELGVKFTYVPTSFDAVLPGLQNGRFDLGFASFGSTPQRLAALNFIPERSDGTAYASLKSSNMNVAKLADLCGKSVAELTGAYDYTYLTGVSQTTCVANGQAAITLTQFPTQAAAQLAVTSGRVQLVAAGSATLNYWAKQTGTIAVSSLIANAVYNCIGVKKNSMLGPLTAKALQDLITSGVYAKIMAHWGLGTADPVTRGMLLTLKNPTGAGPIPSKP